MTIQPLKLKLSKKEFTDYVQKVDYKQWKPIGCVMHNTYRPDLAMVDDYVAGKNLNGKNDGLKTWPMPQLIDNWWQNYIRMKWNAGPHLFIYRDGIYVATPLDHRGTHSPSYNGAYYGVELIGDYERETLPDDIKYNTIHALKVLFQHLKMTPTELTLKFHREDPKTTHKCPGKNFPDKQQWLNWIKEYNIYA